MVRDTGDEIGVDAVAAVGKHRVGRSELHRGDRACAQRHRQIGGMLVGFESETGHPVLPILGAHSLQDANGDDVLGAGKPCAHGHGTVVLAIVVLGLPGLPACHARTEEQGSVVDHRGRCEALFQSGGVDERLERRTWLAPGLGDMVELVLVEVKAAHQGTDGTGTRIDGHESTFHLRKLGDFPSLLGCLYDPDDRAPAQFDVGRGFLAESGLRWLEAFARDLDLFAIGAGRQNPLGVDLQHDRGEHIAVIRVVGQSVVDGVFGLLRRGGQADKPLRPAIVLSALVVHDALAQRGVGCLLLAGIQRGVHIQSARVCLGAVLRVDELTRHLGHVLRMDAGRVRRRAQLEIFLLCSSGFLGSDEAVFQHAINDVQLPDPCALGVRDGVVSGRGLRKASKHGCFGNGYGLQRLAKISFCGCCKSIGAISQINLVHVDLENLVLC